MSTQPEQCSRAWQMGREAALAGSHRQPPAKASAKWKAEYWAGWQVTHDQREVRREEFRRRMADLGVNLDPMG